MSKMATKEDLMSMKYKELVVIAKQCGVYKSRSKKVYLLRKLKSLPDIELLISQHHSTKASEIEAFEAADTFCFNTNEKDSDSNHTPQRKETFTVNKGDSDANLSSNRRGTYTIDKEETERISASRRSTFSIDRSKNNSPVETKRTSISRQSTFIIDEHNKNKKSEEMSRIICKEVMNSPKIRPYIVNKTPSSLVRFRSPSKNSVSVPPSSGRSIGQRIEKQRLLKSEIKPSNTGYQQQKNYSINEVSSTPIRIHKTSMKGGRIEKKITPSKLPNFKAIHMKEFSKMESIVEHSHRKAERSKILLKPAKLNHTPITKLKAQSLSTTRIPVKSDLKPIDSETKTASGTKPITITPNKGNHNITLHNNKNILSLRKSQLSNNKEKLKFLDSPMTKVRRKSTNNIENINNKLASKPKRRIHNVKEIVSTKIHPFSVERNRAKIRDLLQTVRINRRFQLQMEVMRKTKV